MAQFGIDVDHVDQMELVRRAEREVAAGTRVDAALAYLKQHVGKIHWTAADATFRLTEDLLKKQLGMYYGAIDLIEEFGYDFCGIKGQRELTEHYATADVAEAFLNDPYHPDGTPKPSIVCSTEADSDAALESIGVQLFDHIIVGGEHAYSFSTGAVIGVSGAEAEVFSLSDYQALQAQAVRTGALLRVMEPY